MGANIWFWIIFVVSFLFGGWCYYPISKNSGGFLVVMILLALLGYRVFGGPVQ